MNNELSSIGSIIARIDNDFNIMNSDYIPRVAAWCIDAMNEMGILQYDTKSRNLQVSDKIAYFPCCVKAFNVYYDGCEIPNAKEARSCCQKGEVYQFEQDREKDSKYRSRRTVELSTNAPTDRNYVYLADSNAIELNFEADTIRVTYLSVKTVYDNNFHCDVPVIPYDGKLITALEWYCMWKILSRGTKHPVYSLQGQLSVNPYLLWKDSRDKARTSVIVKNQGDISSSGWSSFFYNATFRPRS